MNTTQVKRCSWAESDPLMTTYHDSEWGVPLHNDQRLFEFLMLEGAQAGLSWLTILRKRENYRAAFHGFDPQKVAGYSAEDVGRLLSNPGIIRNRGKIQGAITNAKMFLRIQEEFGSFDAYIWRFVAGRPIQNAFRTLAQVPSKTKEAEAMSRDLKSRGFTYVGPIVCYAHMQATGMVNDHLVTCFRYADCRALA